MRPIAILLFLMCAAACTHLPDLADPSGAFDSSVEYPDLVPLDSVAFKTSGQDEAALRFEQDTDARVATLRARAERLRAEQVN